MQKITKKLDEQIKNILVIHNTALENNGSFDTIQQLKDIIIDTMKEIVEKSFWEIANKTTTQIKADAISDFIGILNNKIKKIEEESNAE